MSITGPNALNVQQKKLFAHDIDGATRNRNAVLAYFDDNNTLPEWIID